MSAIRGKSNKTTELRLRMALVRAGVTGWVLHSPDILGKPDFFFPLENLALFVDGCFWHGCPRCGHVPNTRSSFWHAKITRNKLRDRRTSRILRARGLKVCRIWEHKLKYPTGLEKTVLSIKKMLSNTQSRQC